MAFEKKFYINFTFHEADEFQEGFALGRVFHHLGQNQRYIANMSLGNDRTEIHLIFNSYCSWEYATDIVEKSCDIGLGYGGYIIKPIPNIDVKAYYYDDLILQKENYLLFIIFVV